MTQKKEYFIEDMKGDFKMEISKNLKEQIKAFIRQGETLVNIINYLFTCDYTETETFKILVKHFGCDEQLLKDVFIVDFGIEFSPYFNMKGDFLKREQRNF